MNKPEIIKDAKVAVYDEFRGQLEQLAKDNASLVFDYEEEKGLALAKAHIKTLKKTKTALEKVRKAEKQESLDYGRLVDSEAKAIAGKIDEMIAVHETPINEIEEREQARKDALKKRVSDIYAINSDELIGVSAIQAAIDTANSIVIDGSFEEWKAAAALAKTEVLETLGKMLTEAEAREAELAAQRAAEEAARIEREKEIAAEAAAKAKADAENAARIAQEKQQAEHEAEIKRIEEEQAAAIIREQEKQAEHEAELARLKADDEHRESIHNAIIDSLMDALDSEALAAAVVHAIASGQIPHVSINYRG